jgi:transposase InsO family protein
LQMRHKPPRRRVSAKLREGRTEATHPNQCWSMDFMADELFDGRRLRLLTIVDNVSRVSPFIGVGFRYRGYDVVTALNLAVASMGCRNASGWTTARSLSPRKLTCGPMPMAWSWTSPGRGSPRTMPSSNRSTAAFDKNA